MPADHTLDGHATAAAPATPGDASTGGGFRLDLRFSGLCLCVPEPTAEARGSGGLVHVLMMNVGEDTPVHGWSRAPSKGHDHGAAGSAAGPKHYCMLYVDEGHFAQGTPLTGRMVGIPLRDTVLRLPEHGGGISASEPLDESVLPLHEITAVDALPREWIGPRPRRQVAARVVVTAGKSLPPTAKAWWEIIHPGEPKPEEWPWPIASHLGWRVDNVAGHHLTLSLRSIDDDRQVVRTIHLYPKDSALGLHVCCLPVYELPGAGPAPVPQAGEFAEHFEAYFALFPGVRPPRLRLKGADAASGDAASAQLAPRRMMTSETSVCTTAQVRLAADTAATP